MKKTLIIVFVLLLIVIGTLFHRGNSHDSEWDDADFYTELNYKSGSEEFARAADFLQITNEMLEDKEIHFYLYEKDSQTELHAIIESSHENCSSIHARELLTLKDIFRNISLNSYNAQSVTHTCTGADCSSCRFTRDENEEINGCDCYVFFGRCNYRGGSSELESEETSEIDLL